MDIILIRGKGDAGKTTTATMVYDQLYKVATEKHLFDHYNAPLKDVVYNKNGEPHDFKAVLVVKGKIIVIITAGDEVQRLLINIKFIIDFVKQQFNVDIDILITCGRSINRQSSAYLKLKGLYPKSKLSEIWVSRVEEAQKILEKQKAVNEIMVLL